MTNRSSELCLHYSIHLRLLQLEYKITRNPALVAEIEYAKKLYDISIIYHHHQYRYVN